jgi:16S rRNA (adenine1518-N6/adenine1519-N6)-dimethyltransferase
MFNCGSTTTSNNISVIEGDFLEVDPFKVDVVIGNLPYYISSQITFRLLDWNFEYAVLMYQKEFCEKLYAKGKDRSRISFFAQYYFDITPQFTIPRTAFSPKPKVDSQLVILKPKNVSPLPEKVSASITFLFTHRPKAIGSSIRMFCKQNKIIKYENVLAKLSDHNLQRRVFELENNEILEIGKKMSEFIC